MPGLFSSLLGGLGANSPSPAGGLGGGGGLFGMDREALGMLGAGMMNRNMAGGMMEALKFQGMRRQQNMTAKLLLNRGIAKSEEEALAMAQQPALINALMKDQQGLINAGDGNLYNPNTKEWITAPGAGGDYAKRAAAAIQFGLSPDDPAYQGYVLTGKMPKEDQQSLTPTDKKAMWAAEDEIPLLDNTLGSLKRAKELNKKTYTGYGAGLAGEIGTNMPGGDYIFDGETARATSEFNKIMSMEAIQSMAQTLKGATTDQELARFVSILADPASDPVIREKTIDRMIQLAERVKQVKTDRIKSINPDNPMGAETLGDGVVDYTDYFKGP